MNRAVVLGSLQTFIRQRGVEVPSLTAHPAIELMVDWFRLVPIDGIAHTAPADTLTFRYGGWSEGCATGFKIRMQRRLELPEPGSTGNKTAVVGIALLFATDRFGDLVPLVTSSTDWRSLEAFVAAIEGSPGFLQSAAQTPSEVIVEVDETR